MRCRSPKAARLTNIFHHFTEQSVRIIPLSKEPAVERIQPPFAPDVGEQRQAAYRHINPAAHLLMRLALPRIRSVRTR